MTTLHHLLDQFGSAGLRLNLDGNRLIVAFPTGFPADALAPLRADQATTKAAVARMDADLAGALATLDTFASAPGASPSLLRIIQMRREVYAAYRERLADHDLLADASAFVDRCINPPQPDLDCLNRVARWYETNSITEDVATLQHDQEE